MFVTLTKRIVICDYEIYNTILHKLIVWLFECASVCFCVFWFISPIQA